MADIRSILVTGGTAALGYECALKIAREHADYLIVVASRTDHENSAEAINQAVGRPGAAVYMPLDLSDLSKVRAFAKDWETKRLPPIQALVLNAGLQFPTGLHKTADGIESTFGINHVGHALLFHLLLPHLTSNARVVITSSGTHDPAQKSGMPPAVYNTAEELAHPPPDSVKAPGRQRYTSSKLCNVLWGYALSRRLQQKGRTITVSSFDPGLMPGTGLAREGNGIEKFLWHKVLPRAIPIMRAVQPNIHTPAESGAALARLAVGPDVQGVTGKYYEGLKEIKSSTASYDESKQEDLWRWTVRFVSKGDETEARRFDELASLK